MTNHMWSGFNLLAHLPTWQRLPADIQGVIDRNVTSFVRLQRQDQEQINAATRGGLVGRGLVFNDVDPAPFRGQLSGLYGTWEGGSARSPGPCSRPRRDLWPDLHFSLPRHFFFFFFFFFF